MPRSFLACVFSAHVFPVHIVLRGVRKHKFRVSGILGDFEDSDGNGAKRHTLTEYARIVANFSRSRVRRTHTPLSMLLLKARTKARVR